MSFEAGAYPLIGPYVFHLRIVAASQPLLQCDHAAGHCLLDGELAGRIDGSLRGPPIDGNMPVRLVEAANGNVALCKFGQMPPIAKLDDDLASVDLQPLVISRQGRRRRVEKPAGWPRYMIAKLLKCGEVSYYWNARNRDNKRGFTLHREPLGTNYATAISRADQLNLHLDAWRSGRGETRSLSTSARYGTVDWWFEEYYRSDAFTKLRKRTQPSYRQQINILVDLPTKTGARLGTLPALSHRSGRGQDLQGPSHWQTG